VSGEGDDAHITNWIEARWRLAYRIKTREPGTYRVIAEITAVNPSALRLDAGRKHAPLEVKLNATGGAEKWRRVELGIMNLQAGEILLTLRGGQAGWNPINIKNIILTPVEK
jgi:hypothetical protein